MLALSNFHEPGVWLVISVLCGVALLAGWSFTPNVWRPWLAFSYWVAIPYLALLTGAVSPRLMGLRYMDWSNSFQAGAALFLVLVVLATRRPFADCNAAATPAGCAGSSCCDLGRRCRRYLPMWR